LKEQCQFPNFAIKKLANLESPSQNAGNKVGWKMSKIEDGGERDCCEGADRVLLQKRR
jgi:hypothetical protein